MYKDNGKINVELLAEVGDIAHRIRSLDERLASSGYLDDPRYLQQQEHYQGASAHSSSDTESKSEHQCSERRTSSAAQIAQDIGDRLSSSAGALDSESTQSQPQQQQPSQQQPPQPHQLQQRRYSSKQVEDIILEYYEKHLIYHQNLEKQRLVNSAPEITEPRRSRIYRLTGGDSYNMNNASSSKESNTCSTSNSGDNADINVSIDHLATEQTTKPNELTADLTSEPTTTATVTTNPAIGKRNSIANQPMPEIQISNSDEQPKPRKSLTTEQQHEPKEPPTDSGEDKADPYGIPTTTTGGICGHYCAGWQTPTWSNQLDDDVLRSLVMELKHKIEFTERMNWLCKYPHCGILDTFENCTVYGGC